MKGLGIHPLLANVSMITETLGGLLMILGLATPVAATALSVNMGVAVYELLKTKGVIASFTSGQHPEAAMGVFFSATLFAIAFSLIFLGAGSYSLDSKFFRTTKKKA
jgi:putative oxidoreductase